MKNLSKYLFLTVLMLGFYAPQALAQSCGDLVFTDITLSSDLNCNSGFYALEVRADNITIDLNGHSIYGKGVNSGIRVLGYDNVTIRNGQIQGFSLAVNTANTQGLTVTGIEFYRVGSGVVISSGVFADVYNNQFYKTTAPAVSVVNFVAGQYSNGVSISDNEFYQARVGIEVCGDDADNVLIYNNDITRSADYGIHMMSSQNNIVQGNIIEQSDNIAIRLDDTTNTDISGNSLFDGGIGLAIYGDAGSACLAGGPPGSSFNRFTSNHSIGFNVGVYLGNGGPVQYVSGNEINGNKIYNDNIGIWFRSDTAFNDGTGNAYSGTTTPIIDMGSSNVY